MDTSIIPFQRVGNIEEVKKEREKGFQEAISSILKKKTPKSVIYQREGRGGRKFDYIQGWWIIEQLNFLFDFNWDWEIMDQSVGKSQVWVRGRLTVKRVLDDGTILSSTKSAYGGAEIKRYSSGNARSGEVLDLGNDLKAASTDAFKKSASLLGIAADIYGKDEASLDTAGGIDSSTLKALWLRGSKVNMDEEATKEWCSKWSGFPFEDFTKVDAQKALRELVKLGTTTPTKSNSKQ